MKDIILNVARAVLKDSSDAEISSVSIERFLQKDHAIAGVSLLRYERYTAYSMTQRINTKQYKVLFNGISTPSIERYFFNSSL